MIISTPHIERTPRVRRSSRYASQRGGFTLTEVMIAATLSTFILAGILSAFLLIGRTSYNSSNYSELEAEARRGLETFAEDARKASDIRWNSSQSITLTVPTETSASTLVTYAYDNVPASSTHGCFYRLPGEAGATLTRQILVRQVTSDFAFHRYKIEQPGVTDNTASSDLETKQIQLTLRATRAGATTVTANHAVLSATYILRNKRVSN